MNEDRNVELVIQLFSYGFSICVWFFCPSFSPRWKSKCVNVNIFIHRSSMIWSGDSAKANRRGRLRNKDKEHFDCSKYPIRSSINIDSYLTQAHHRHCHHVIAYHFFSFFSSLGSFAVLYTSCARIQYTYYNTYYVCLPKSIFLFLWIGCSIQGHFSTCYRVTSLHHNWLRSALIE